MYIQVNDELCQLMGVQCNITSAYHPQSNGLDERFNQTLQRQLLMFVREERTEWDLYLDAILFSYRVSRQDSTKMSPFYLVYGRQARLPVEVAMHPTDEEADEVVETEEVNLDEHITRMVGVRKKALENIANAQKRQKQQYDAKHSRGKEKYKVGALVLIKNSKKFSRKGSKMEPNWLGPYRIHKVLDKGPFQICKTSNNKFLTQVYNMTRLKLYYPAADPVTSPGKEIQDPSSLSPSPDPTLPASSQDPALYSHPHYPPPRSLTQNFVSSPPHSPQDPSSSLTQNVVSSPLHSPSSPQDPKLLPSCLQKPISFPPHSSSSPQDPVLPPSHSLFFPKNPVSSPPPPDNPVSSPTTSTFSHQNHNAKSSPANTHLHLQGTMSNQHSSACQCHSRCHSSNNCPCRKEKTYCSLYCHPGHTCTNCNSTSTDVVDLTVVNTETAKAHLEDHQLVLSSNAWLDDKIIDLGQAMLKKQHPHIGGLQSVVLGEKLAFTLQTEEFVQVLNINNNHWIVISTIGCKQATVNVYDSLHGRLPSHAKCVIADLLRSQEAEITINYMDVQWQSNGYDCGLFALANAAMLCNVMNPTKFTLDQGQMRKHLANCLETGRFTVFPIRGRRRKISPPHMETFPIYCICRLPDDGSQMIECDKCQNWFHTNCVRATRAALAQSSAPWHCSVCVRQ